MPNVHAGQSTPTTRSGSAGFTLVELLVVIAIIGVLVGLLLPAVQSAREASRRTACSNKMKQLLLGLTRSHDSARRFPAAIDRYPATAVTFASTGGPAHTNPGGFSWVVYVLPFIEESSLYDGLSAATGRFGRGAYPFQPSLPGTAGGHASQVPIPLLGCPSYAGLPVVVGAAGSSLRSLSTYDGSSPFPNIAITNYKAMAGVASQGKLASLADNGGLPLKGPKTVNPDTDDLPTLGLDIDGLRDGTSSTILLSESREGANSAWIDGMQTFVVALADDSVATPTLEGKSWNLGQAKLSLGYGPTKAEPTRTCLALGPRGTLGNSAWGPSSDHPGLVTTGFADGHVTMLATDTDPTVYLGLVTRAVGETVAVE